MIQPVVYFGSFAIQAATIGLSITSLVQTSWVTSETPKQSPVRFKTEYGLYKRCDSSSWTGTSTTCRKFPSRSQDCAAPSKHFTTLALASAESNAYTPAEHTASAIEVLTELEPSLGLRKGEHDHGNEKDEEMWTFCDSWNTAGYAGLLSVTFGIGALFANVLVMISRRVKHRGGWRIVAILAALHGAWMLVAVALVAYEFNHDDRFYIGSRYGASFIMAATSSGLNWLVAALVTALGLTVGNTPERTPLLGSVRRTIH